LSNWLWAVVAVGAVASQGVDPVPLRIALGEVVEDVRLDPANCALVTRSHHGDLNLWRCGDSRHLAGAQVELLSVTERQLALRVAEHPHCADCVGTRILVGLDSPGTARITFALRSTPRGQPAQRPRQQGTRGEEPP
jgi:hypothetical protein